MTASAAARDAQIQMLLASVVNWRPAGGLFGGNPLGGLLGLGDGAAPSGGPLSFSSGLLSLLSDARGGG
jgi:hypothetical protein